MKKPSSSKPKKTNLHQSSGVSSSGGQRPNNKRTPAPSKRIFIAYELPDDLKQTFVELEEELNPRFKVVKWVEPEVMHLTLAFFGDVPVPAVEKIRQFLRETAGVLVGVKNCEARGLGAFPDWRRPSTLWAGVGKGVEEIVETERVLRKALAGIGIRLEDRRFIPHLTLGRIRPPHPLKDRSFVDRLENELFGHFEALSLTLFESELHRDGTRHIPIESYELF